MDAMKQNKLRSLLTEAIVNLCQKEAYYVDELRIEGTICVVADRSSVVIAHITEYVGDAANLSDSSDLVDLDVPPKLEVEHCLDRRERVPSTSHCALDNASDSIPQLQSINDNIDASDCGSTMRQSLTILSDINPATPKSWTTVTAATTEISDNLSADVSGTASASGKFRCPHCDKSFGFKHTLRDHMSIHVGRRPHVCQQCNASFVHLAMLCAHVKRHHVDVIPGELACPLCGEKAIDLQLLKQHYTWHHHDIPFPLVDDDVKPVVSVDGTSSTMMSSLDVVNAKASGSFSDSSKHTRRPKRKLTEMKVDANMLPNGIANDFGSANHSAGTVTNDSYELDSMALLESFERQDYKNMMSNAGGGIMTSNNYAVEGGPSCSEENGRNPLQAENKAGTETSSKKVAMFFDKISDGGMYAYRCRYCGSQFKHRSNLREHVNSHLGVRPHACAHCGDRFAHHSSLYNHMRNKHSMVTVAERQALLRHSCFGCHRRFRYHSELERHLRCNPEHISLGAPLLLQQN